MLKDFQARNALPRTGRLSASVKKLMNTPRCGVRDIPRLVKTANSWPKTSLTWRLRNKNLPSLGLTKIREQIRQSFEDWATHSPLTFKEVSENEKADLDLAFTDQHNDSYFDGPGKTLAYAHFPTVGEIRFNAMQPWTEKYGDDDINLRLVATHQIGHALGLDHSHDPTSIMTPYYQPMQPEDMLPEDDSDGIQALYGPRLSSDSDQTTVVPNAGQYEGQLKEGKKHGHGIYKSASGDKYEGEYKDDKKHGRGTYTWASGDKYIGDWVNGNMHGQGIYTWANGDKYIGDWVNHKQHGQGTKTWANGDKYIGDWVNGKSHGQGTKTWASGDKYEGQYKDGNYHGRGTYTWVSGRKYIGDWVNGYMHGRGKMFYPDGRIQEGTWRNDSFTDN